MNLQQSTPNGSKPSTIQKYIKYLGAVQAITDTSKGSPQKKIAELGRLFKISPGTAGILIKEFLDKRISGKTISFTWKPSNKDLTFKQMAVRIADVQRQKDKEYRLKQKGVSTPNAQIEETPIHFVEPENEYFKGSIKSVQIKVQHAMDRLQTERAGLEKHKQAIQACEENITTIENGIKELENVIRVLSILSGDIKAHA